MNTTINPSYFDVHQGYRVLTHSHIAIDGLPGTGTILQPQPLPQAFLEASAEGPASDSVLDAGVGGERSSSGSENGRGVGTTTEVQQKWTFE